MPELPEVHTTATILNKLIAGKKIIDVWTDYGGSIHKGADHIKDPAFLKNFKKIVTDTKIQRVHRRGKNVLIELDNSHTILVHMKMTGHLLYGSYKYAKGVWQAKEQDLQDPFNRFVHLVFTLDNGKSVALCDVRKFAKVTHIPTELLETSSHLSYHGPEPLDDTYTAKDFQEALQSKPKLPIKRVMMMPEIVSGIGNIYSDEILWAVDVHPLSKPKNIPDTVYKKMYTVMKEILSKGIDFGGDSTSDYRNPYGVAGKFQYHHMAYRRTGQKCEKKGCTGTIHRIAMNNRGAHFCNVHQKVY